MQLSNKIGFQDHLLNEPRLENFWGGVFFHPSFITPACEALRLNGQPSYINVDKKQIGAANFLVGEKPLIRSATLPLLFQYFGPIMFDPSQTPITLAALDSFLSHACDFAFLSFPPDICNLDGLSSKWKIFSNMTLALKGDDLKRWGSDFRDDVKNKIRKASREKVEISESDTLPINLWSIAYTRRGMKPPIDPVSLNKWSKELLAFSLLKIYVAKIDNREVAFRGELILGDYAYDWIAGSAPEFHSSGANQLLMAETGREITKLNCTTWDLVGGEVSSIADFKRSFGAKEVSYFQVSRSFGAKGKAFELLRKIRHGRK